MQFKLQSEYKPTGDQPQAIEKLVKGIEIGEKYQTLLGVTGSGKTFTVANVVQIDATTWRITSADGLLQETLILANAAVLDRSDWSFI